MAQTPIAMRQSARWRRYRCCLAMALFVAAWLCTTPSLAKRLQLSIQRRDAANVPYTATIVVDSSEVAILEVDLWNAHPDSTVAYRFEAMVPRVNDVFRAARELGIPTIHAQADIPLATLNPTMNNRQPLLDALADPSVPAVPGPNSPDLRPAPSAPPGYSNQIPPDTPGVLPFPTPPSPNPGNPGAAWDNKHPDLVIEDSPLDLVLDAQVWWGWDQPSKHELYAYTQQRGIKYLIYAGGATNISANGKTFGQIDFHRLGYEVLVPIDMSDSYTSNGRDVAGNPAPWRSPDQGTREGHQWVERTYAGTLSGNQIFARAGGVERLYSSRIGSEPDLLSYWRMDGKNGYHFIHDLRRNEGAWNAEHVTLGVAGALTHDANTAARFDGTSALLVSPFYREDTPNSSPLEGLSKRSFSVEAWVQFDGGLGSPRWIMSHDDGTTAGTDFLLGLDATGRFRFVTGGFANDLVSPWTVTQADIDQNRWFHVVGVQDLVGDMVTLYVDGDVVASAPHVGSGVSTRSSLQIGSRGATDVADGEAGEGNNGAVLSSGFEHFIGSIDEVAIYSAPLTRSDIAEHFLLASFTPMPGDINGDGVVTGDGSGSPAADDVAAFVAGWGYSQPAAGSDSWAHGDLNLDGVVDLEDWSELRAIYAGAGNSLAALPEPSTVAIAVLAIAILPWVRHSRKRLKPMADQG